MVVMVVLNGFSLQTQHIQGPRHTPTVMLCGKDSVRLVLREAGEPSDKRQHNPQLNSGQGKRLRRNFPSYLGGKEIAGELSCQV